MKMYKETNFIGCEASFDEASFLIAGIPYDGTSSFRPGSRFGPDDIRKSSYSIETFSHVQEADLTDMKICDMGNLELPFGNRDRVLAETEALAQKIIDSGKKGLYIGGEHLLTLPLVRRYAEKYKGLRVIHFDAHADMRDEMLGERYSHATVARRLVEMVGAKSHYMFGIRSFEKDEYEFIKKNKIFCDSDFDRFFESCKKLKNTPVYFTLDLDVFNPAELPGLGTPEAGGIGYKDYMEYLLKGLSTLDIVGMDVLEMAPHCDPSGNSGVFAAKVIRELILATGR